MLWMRGLLTAAILIGSLILTAELAAYDGYGPYGGGFYYDPPYTYRNLERTGKYHGYWRDMGYGVRRGEGVYISPYYGVPYGGGVYLAPPAGGYLHPPASFPYRYQY